MDIQTPHLPSTPNRGASASKPIDPQLVRFVRRVKWWVLIYGLLTAGTASLSIHEGLPIFMGMTAVLAYEISPKTRLRRDLLLAALSGVFIGGFIGVGVAPVRLAGIVFASQYVAIPHPERLACCVWDGREPPDKRPPTSWSSGK